MHDNNNQKNKFSDLKGVHKAIPIILGGLALFIGLCLIIPGMGVLGDAIRGLLLGLFSFGAYIIPIALAVHAICYAGDLAEKKLVSGAIFSVVATLLVSCIDYAIFYWGREALFSPAESFANMNGGGFIGGVLGFLLTAVFGQLGVIIVSVVALAIYAVFYYAEKAGAIGQAALKVAAFFKKIISLIKGKHNEIKEKKQQLKEEEDQHQRELTSQELIDDEFFTAKGETAEIKIKKLGIEEGAGTHGLSPLVDPAKRIVEEEPEVIVAEPERRRRRGDKPLDLSYGIEEEPEEVIEEPDEIEKEEDKPKYSNSFLGIDESADAVFTKDFDPFDFATSEKAAAKYASKVSTKSAVAEELDDMTIAEMRANHEPDERERRMMELERKKREWMNRQAKTRPTPAPAAPQSAPVVKEAPMATPAFTPAPTPVASPITTSIPTPAPAPMAAPAEESEVSAYSSYSNTKTTYSQPIKTVEFTITKEPKPAPAAPSESAAVSYSFDKASEPHAEEAAEDVAILISQRIAKSNPAYARSANDLKTYTKIVSDEDDELYRQLNGISTPAENAECRVQSAELEVQSEEPKKESARVVEEIEEDDNELILKDEQTEDKAEATEESISEPAPEAEETPVEAVSEPVSEPVLPESVEFSVGTEKTVAPEPTAQSIYQRAAAFASAMVSEPSPVPEFKPYTPPTAPVQPVPAVSEPVNETLVVERSMLSPTPTAPVTEPADVPDEVAVAPAAPVVAPIVVPVATPVTPVVPAEPAIVSEALFSVVDEEECETEAMPTEKTIEAAEVSFGDEDDEEPDVEIDEDEDEDGEEEPDDDAEIEEIPPEEQNPDVIKMREMFPFLAPLDQQKPVSKPTAEVRDEISISADLDEDDIPFDEPIQVKMPSTALVPKNEKKEEKKSKKPDYSDYRFPSLDLLAKETSALDENIQAEIQENADKLIETLASFGVTASIKGVDRGPRITRYEVVPAKGVKVSQIMNLQDDIALNLAAGSIRMEAPIPGKSAVGIEIPNKKSSIVRLRDLLETADFEGSKSKTFVCIGRDVAGQPVFGDLAKMPHLLIAGATGMGKSVCINSLLISVLYKARPDEVKLIMIDPKQVEFTMYNGIPHLLVPVVSDPKQAAGALMWAVEEMDRRFDTMKAFAVRNVDAYNEKVEKDRSLGEPLSKIIIVIDEFADLMLQVKDPVESLVMRIAQKARAAGIHLVIGTQRPSVNVITGVIKANVPSRISCKVMSNVDSKTVLDSGGAEKLLDKGDSLYAPSGSPKPHRVQCAFVADGEVEAIMDYLRQYSNGDTYDSTVMEDIERAAQKCNKKGGGSDRDDSDADSGSGEGYLNDRQFLDAVEVAVNSRKISTSLIQRKLSIGYGKAAKFIDIMEDMGIVGEANGQRPREVLLTPDEWREKLARASLD